MYLMHGIMYVVHPIAGEFISKLMAVLNDVYGTKVGALVVFCRELVGIIGGCLEKMLVSMSTTPEKISPDNPGDSFVGAGVAVRDLRGLIEKIEVSRRSGLVHQDEESTPQS